MELLCQAIHANDLDFLNNQHLIEIRDQVDRVAVRLTGLSKSR